MKGCATCGAAPAGTYNDGSPRYPSTCDHPPLYGGQAVLTDDGLVVVELDAFAMTEAFACGKLRFDRAEKRKAKDHFGKPSLDAHVMGAQGERAFSEWIGEPWECTTGRYNGAADVRGCQIRTVSKTSLMAKVRDNDPGRIPVVSIVAHPPRFMLRGWILARDAKRPEWVADPGGIGAPAFFVPTHELRSMAEFMSTGPVRAALGLAPIGVE